MKYWTAELQQQYELLQKRIRESSIQTLANFDYTQQLVLVTDASNSFWASILGIEGDSDASALDSLYFKPMYFLSGKFSGSSFYWTVSDKELYPILRSLLRFRFLTEGTSRRIKIFTDHSNIVHLFRPGKSLKACSVARLYRWVIILQSFRLVVYHVQGTVNKLADVLTRWATLETPAEQPLMEIGNMQRSDVIIGPVLLKNGTSTSAKYLCATNSVTVSKVDTAWETFVDFRISFLHPKFEPEWKPLSQSILKKYQRFQWDEMNEDARKQFYFDARNVLRNVKSKRIVVPNPVKAHLIYHNHVASGHAAPSVQMESIKDLDFGVTASRMMEILSRLQTLCLHCDGPTRLIRRKLGSIPHGEDINVVLHMDYLKLWRGYWLVLVDDFSRRVMLKYTEKCTVDAAISALIAWHAYGGFRYEFILVSDQGSHFCNEIFRQFQQHFPFVHKLGICYSPWTNGSAETTHTLLIKSLRVLTSQYMLPQGDWWKLTELVAAFVNNKPRLEVGGYTANQIYSGRFLREFTGEHLVQSKDTHEKYWKRDYVVPIMQF